MTVSKKTKILFLNPPFRERFSRSQRSPGVTKSGTLYYPILLSCAAGFLEQNGYSVRLIDAPAEGFGRDTCYASVRDFKPDIAVLDTSTPSIASDIEIARDIKKMAGATVVLVGSHASVMADAILSQSPDAVDLIARKEYENTLLELAGSVGAGKDLSSVPGVSFRKGAAVVHNPDRAYERDLDRFPFVSAVYKKHLHYRNYGYSITRYPVIAMLTSRGCPFRCSFCLYPQTVTGHEFRVRSIANVIEEIKYIRSEFRDVRDIFIEDDTFTVDRQRVREFCDAIIREKLRVTWTANARADLDYDLLKHMKAAGNRLLCVGFESSDRSAIKKMEKGTDPEGMKRFADDAHRAGILVHGCFIFGSSSDTRQTLKETLKFAKSLPLSSAQFLPLMAYPGTRMYRELKEAGYLETEDYSRWVDEHGFHSSVVRYPHLSGREIVALCNKAKISYHFRPAFLVRKLAEIIRMPQELPRNIGSMAMLLKNSIRDIKRYRA